MRKKIIISSLLIMLLCVGAVSAATNWGKFEGFNIIKLVINGKEAKVQDVPAVMLNGRTMVPIYMLREAGLSVSWDGKKNTVSVKNNQSSSTNNNTTDVVKKIMAQGGSGVTFTNIDNDMTSIVYFESKKGFDNDWDYIFNVFVELMNYDTTYSRVSYGVNGVEQGFVEIENKNLNSYLRGNMTEDQLLKSWILSGALFSQNSNSSSASTITSYPELYSNDLTEYLGKLTTNEYDIDSVFNEYGNYGSKYSNTSIWNTFGDYGSSNSNKSAFNKFTTTPPVMISNDKVIGYVTTNTTINNGVTPNDLKSYLEKLGY